MCDANDAMNPAELTEEIGRRLKITLPEGVPGVRNALGPLPHVAHRAGRADARAAAGAGGAADRAGQ